MSSDKYQTELDAYESVEENVTSRLTENSSATKDNSSSEKSEFRTGDPITNEYLETVAGAEIRESTAKRYEASLRSYIRYLKARENSLLDAEAKDVKNFFRECSRNNLSESTIASHLTAISNVYKYIRIESEFESEMDLFSLDTISKGDFTAREKAEKEPLSKTELDELCDVMDRRNRLMVILASEIGARNGSLRSIKMSDVNLDDEKPKVKVTNQKSGGKYPIPISNQMALELERWMKVERDPDTEKTDNEYLFPSAYGGKLKYGQSFNAIVKKAAEEVGIQQVVFEREVTKAEKRAGCETDMKRWYRVTPHLLRHTFSLLLEEAGLDTEARRDALDHENIETTKDYYTHSESDYEELIRELLHRDNSDDDSDDNSD